MRNKELVEEGIKAMEEGVLEKLGGCIEAGSV
jgi:hypothetical protein